VERLFVKSIRRNVTSLNGQWSIGYDPQRRGDSLGYEKGKGPVGEPIYVPSCWDIQFDRYDYKGAAWYRRTFLTEEPGPCRLIFHAVSGQAVIFLDGKKLGDHYGSYTKFWFDISRLSAGEHLLVVKVDNEVNDRDTMPLRFVDWFVWGGIYREVELEHFQSLSIDKIRIHSEWNQYQVSEVTVCAQIKNWTDREIRDDFFLEIDSRKAKTLKAAIPAGGEQEIRVVLKDFKPLLWDPENPHLYTFRVGCSTDDLYERTGFRKIETKKDKVLLNGKEIFLKGVNRHNDHPELGYAVNPPLILRDMQILKDLGVNAIRGSHYPNDPVVLDYCDQMGFLFWEELAFWNHPAEALASPLLEQRALQMAREMIDRDANHPSLIVWGIQNESKSSSPEGRALFSKLASEMRRLDNSRLISFASACGRNDLCFDFLDVICWNMYPGWYDDDKPLDDLEDRFSAILKDIRKWLIQNGQDKPFWVTEFGAGALLGETTFESGRRWTENYQQKLLENGIRGILRSQAVQGFFIWQFCDGRTNSLSRISIGRPRCFNNKGLVNEYRMPKLAYYTVRELMHEIPAFPQKKEPIAKKKTKGKKSV
jgi:beta-glucuronidase